ncbi:MAG TPA: DegT/DnrJ/EryC1/StrS family aminotransferase [Planctomycetota bacterium]
MKPVVMFDYREQLAALRPELMAAVTRVLDSGTLILGPEVERFEQAFAGTLGGGGAVGVNSGTDALAIALRALGIGPGDEVLTVANTAVPTVSAIRSTGATPVFCDVAPDTALLDVDDAVRRTGPRTRAIVPVHLYGNVVDVERLAARLSGSGVRIVEDCAQCHGALLRGKPAGTFGDAAAFSFYPTKNLGAFGDGGLCYANDPQLVARMRSIRMYGFEKSYYAEREGINSRLDPLQAALLGVKLPHLKHYVARRRKLAARYDKALSPRIRRVAAAKDAAHSFHLYVVRVPERERVREALQQRGIATGVHYPEPIHLMRGYAFLGLAKGHLPHSELLAAEVLSLPLYPELPEASVDRVASELNTLLG